MLIKKLILGVLFHLRIDRLYDRIGSIIEQLRIMRLNRKLKTPIMFISQGPGGVTLMGDLSLFEIDKTSHLKSNTIIECSGCVKIGLYFHPGRSLTIWSVNHNYKSDVGIPYDDSTIKGPVIIEDFVWCGANVFILPGVRIGSGAVIAGGSVVTKDVLEGQIVGGNPARCIGMRDMEKFSKLRDEKRFF